MQTVVVHEFVFADGEVFGVGTACELAYWQSKGIIDPDARLGRAVGKEDANEDERRKKLWGIGDFMDRVA